MGLYLRKDVRMPSELRIVWSLSVSNYVGSNPKPARTALIHNPIPGGWIVINKDLYNVCTL